MLCYTLLFKGFYYDKKMCYYGPQALLRPDIRSARYCKKEEGDRSQDHWNHQSPFRAEFTEKASLES